MSYSYQTERPYVFTEPGVADLIKIRDNVKRLCDLAGCVRTDKALAALTGDSWNHLACLDYLIERGDIRCITGRDLAAQHQVFVWVFQ